MMRRRGTHKEGANPVAMAAAFEKHLRELYVWLEGKSYVKSLRVEYPSALKEPEPISRKIAAFLGIPLNVASMVQQVDASLYRNRT